MQTETRESGATVRIAAMVEPSLADRLAQAAQQNDRSIAAEIRMALRDHFQEEDNRG